MGCRCTRTWGLWDRRQTATGQDCLHSGHVRQIEVSRSVPYVWQRPNMASCSWMRHSKLFKETALNPLNRVVRACSQYVEGLLHLELQCTQARKRQPSKEKSSRRLQIHRKTQHKFLRHCSPHVSKPLSWGSNRQLVCISWFIMRLNTTQCKFKTKLHWNPMI